jgi:hypothetical protein
MSALRYSFTPRSKARIVHRLFDKKLWVETTDEKLIVDATTGATLQRGWTSYPTYVVDDWVLYSDSHAERTA